VSDGEQSFGAWRTEHHTRAQAHAFHWAERANGEYQQAIEHDDKARRFADKAYLAEPMAEERRHAQFHGVRSTEALKLAEMWARVAQALSGGELSFAPLMERTQTE
jgi:hypothetical protein